MSYVPLLHPRFQKEQYLGFLTLILEPALLLAPFPSGRTLYRKMLFPSIILLFLALPPAAIADNLDTQWHDLLPCEVQILTGTDLYLDR